MGTVFEIIHNSVNEEHTVVYCVINVITHVAIVFKQTLVDLIVSI